MKDMIPCLGPARVKGLETRLLSAKSIVCTRTVVDKKWVARSRYSTSALSWPYGLPLGAGPARARPVLNSAFEASISRPHERSKSTLWPVAVELTAG